VFKSIYLFLIKFVSPNTKKKIFKLQLLCLVNLLNEFINVSFIYSFLLSLFNNGSASKINQIFLEYFKITFNSYSGAILLISVFFISNFFIIYLNYKIYKYSELICNEVSANYYRTILNAQYEKFIILHPAEIIKKLNSEMPLISHGIFQPLLMFFSKLLILFALSIFLALTFSYKVIFIMLFIFLIYLIIFFSIQKITYYYGKKVSLLLSSINKVLYETFNNFQIISLHNLKSYFYNSYKTDLDSQSLVKSLGYLISQSPKTIIETLSFSIMIIIFVYFGLDNSNTVNLYIPILATIAFVGYRILPVGQQLYLSIILIKNSFYVLSTINKDFEYLSIKTQYKKEEIEKKNIIKDIKTLQLKNIFFKYKQDNKFIIKNFNYNFKKDNIYLISADSGKGKTTLINVIMGFLKQQKGTILVNKKNYSESYHENIKKFISYFPQATFLFDANLYENTTLEFNSQYKNLEKFKNSLKEANLLKELSGYLNNKNQLTGHKGSKLSGGQIQRISISRIFYNPKKIIILDEPTNNLDEFNKKIILRNIYKLKKDRILIILSHDKKIIPFVDKVIYL
jgi:ABC-type multidrug transport system fused ATPase/permease subunit